MGDLSNVTYQPQNPYALFSPDQWSNEFSLFKGAALPWPSSYTGYPMDAMGNPITPQAGSGIPDYAQWQANQAAPAPAAATPGTTINSVPASALADLQAQVNQGTINSANATQSNNTGTFGNVNTGIGNSPGAVDAIIGLAKYKEQANQDYAAGKAIGMPQQASAPASVGGGASNNLTYPQVLSLLANPGKVTTPGANVPASATSAQPSSGALQSFLANFKPAQSGPGSQFQNSFADTLKGMGY
jgi:hypothetical protein